MGSGSAVPKLIISNDDLAQIVETSDEWISGRTGIRNRRVLTGTVLSYSCVFILLVYHSCVSNEYQQLIYFNCLLIQHKSFLCMQVVSSQSMATYLMKDTN